MKLKYITLELENCDQITIDGKYIGHFYVGDIEKEFCRVACNAICEINTANAFAIEIHKDANKERFQFEQTQFEDFKQMTFDRLKCPDITHITFELEESYIRMGQEISKTKKYHYSVSWVGESDYENAAQKVYMSSSGHLYIVVADNKDIEDFFNKEEIEDRDYMEFHFDMCNVGDKYDSASEEMTDEDRNN